MAFAVFQGYNRNGNGGTGGSGGAGTGDVIKNITVNTSGDTGQTLPANAFVKAIVLKGTAPCTIRIGNADSAEIILPDTEIIADQRETFPIYVSLPALFPIYVVGVAGTVSISFLYQIVTV